MWFVLVIRRLFGSVSSGFVVGGSRRGGLQDVGCGLDVEFLRGSHLLVFCLGAVYLKVMLK